MSKKLVFILITLAYLACLGCGNGSPSKPDGVVGNEVDGHGNPRDPKDIYSVSYVDSGSNDEAPAYGVKPLGKAEIIVVIEADSEINKYPPYLPGGAGIAGPCDTCHWDVVVKDTQSAIDGGVFSGKTIREVWDVPGMWQAFKNVPQNVPVKRTRKTFEQLQAEQDSIDKAEDERQARLPKNTENVWWSCNVDLDKVFLNGQSAIDAYIQAGSDGLAQSRVLGQFRDALSVSYPPGDSTYTYATHFKLFSFVGQPPTQMAFSVVCEGREKTRVHFAGEFHTRPRVQFMKVNPDSTYSPTDPGGATIGFFDSRGEVK